MFILNEDFALKENNNKRFLRFSLKKKDNEF